jgi:hypothetical protein
VDLTRHPKFLLAFGELASGRFPHCICAFFYFKGFHLLIIVLDKKTFRHEARHFISVNRKIKYTIPTPHNFAKVDFTIKIATRNFYSPLASWRAVVSHTGYNSIPDIDSRFFTTVYSNQLKKHSAMRHDTSFLSTEKLSIQSRPQIILPRSISRLKEILFHYK